MNIWDNLFFTVITDKNLYVKEAVIQMLVLQNLLKQIPKLDSIMSLANASVVLPIEVFEEITSIDENNQPVKRDKNTSLTSIPQILLDAQLIQKSKNDLQILNSLADNLKTIERKQRFLFQKKYSEAQREYQKSIKPLIDGYTSDYSKAKFDLEKIADKEKTTANLKLINVPYPELPEFSYENPVEIDSKYIKNKLSELDFEVLNTLVKFESIETFDEIYQSIDNFKKNASKIIVENTDYTTQYATFGDMVFPLSKGTTSQNISFVLCAQIIGDTNYAFSLTINITASASDMSYYVKLQDGTSSELTYTFSNATAASLVITNFFGINGYYQASNNPVVGFFAEFKLSDGKFYVVDIDDFVLSRYNCIGGNLSLALANTDTNNDVAPKGFGFKQIGIADYKKVVTEICGYRAGEVAHIENVLAGETREKVTTKTHKSEITDFQSQEIETEKLSDTTSTERFEMQTEIAKMQQEQKTLDAHANVHTAWGNTTLDAGANYATNTSKEESNRQAVTQAKEQTQRAMERIVSRIKKEKTVKITDEFVEANKHRFENLTNPSNVSGVYRFINAVYKNQIYNYGKRLMYEFMVPQPSKLHRLGLKVSVANNEAILINKPVDPRKIGFNNFSTIDNTNYKTLLATYEAQDVKPFPEQYKIIGKSYSFTQVGGYEISIKTDDLEIAAGYNAIHTKIRVYAHWDGDNDQFHSFGITVGNIKLFKEEFRNSFQIDIDTETNPIYVLDRFSEKIPISYQSLNYLALNISITIKTEITLNAIETWKKETYEAIIKGYTVQLEKYYEQLASIKAEGTKLLDSNPLFYRETEQLILRKNCISYLIDNTNSTSSRRLGIEMYNDNATFENHQVTISQAMDDYTSFAKFMEQAFEWNLMSYNFYPFYWGNNVEWKDLYQFETNDPTYRSFMQAGMARVVVTVKPGFESAVMHYMAFGQIWNGGQTPILGNPLYLSIIDELKEQEYFIEDIWETVVPTNLVALQESGVSIAGGGLPNADSCIVHKDVAIVENKSTLAVNEAVKSNVTKIT